MYVPAVSTESRKGLELRSRISSAGELELSLIEVDVPGQNGEVKHWSVELGSPSILQRSGWKFSDVKPGQKITAIVNPLRDGRPGGMLYRLTLADGTMRGNGTAPPPDLVKR